MMPDLTSQCQTPVYTYYTIGQLCSKKGAKNHLVAKILNEKTMIKHEADVKFQCEILQRMHVCEC